MARFQEVIRLEEEEEEEEEEEAMSERLVGVKATWKFDKWDRWDR